MKNNSILRRIWVFALLLCAVSGVFAQATYLANVSFSSKTPSGWSIYPTFSSTAPSWKTDTGIVVSAKYAMHGYVPYNPGDTATLVTPFYDCQNYKYVLLRFSHICKVLPSDICRIEYQEDVLGSAQKWRPIPYDAYKGGCATYRLDSGFSHTSYTTWAQNDTLAKPNNGWWKQETFDVSDYAGYSKVRFRFIIRKGKDLGSFIAAGWYIDDFQVIASQYELKPPVVEFTSNLGDTVYDIGPFKITAKVATRTAAKIVNPYLAYSITYEGKTKKDSIKMTATSGDSMWMAEIPQQYYGTEVSYSIFGRDANGNNSTASGAFVTRRAKAGKPKYYTYYYPQDTTGATNGNNQIVYAFTSAISLSRCLYPCADINPQNVNLDISRLAWYIRLNEPQPTVTRNIKVHLLATNDNSLTASYMDPVSNGATLVYDGPTTSVLGWNELIFKKPFNLPSGKNLYVFVEGYGGTTSTTTPRWGCHTLGSGTNTTYSINGGSWTSNIFKPIIRLGIGVTGSYDSNSVALASIDSPTESAAPGTHPVKVTIQNMGDDWLNTCEINWMVNGVLQTPKTWQGHLYTEFMDSIVLGNYTQRADSYDTITVWVSKPNNKVDTVTDDDTLTVIPYGCNGPMKGVFTVGNGSQYDFQSIAEMRKILEACGIGGDVTMKLASGTYTENLMFSKFNVTPPYKVTITSIAGNADSVIFRPRRGQQVVSLSDCSGLVFKNLTFDGRKTAANCIFMSTGLDNIEFNHCRMLGFDTTATNTNFTNIYRASGTPINNIRFIGNEILGGYYGIYIYGGNGTAARGKDFLFDSNYVSGYYYYAAYLYYWNGFTITHNHFDGARSVNSYDYGVYTYYIDRGLINANRFHSHTLNNYVYGLRLYYYDSLSIVSNNELLLENGKSTTYGMYAYYTYGTKIYNNSIRLVGTSGTQYGLYLYTGSTTYYGEIKNNIVVCEGSSTVYPLYATSTTAIKSFDIDYNCWYSSKNVGYVGAAKTTLAAFKSSVPSAVHDIYMSPSFLSGNTTEPRDFSGLDCPNQKIVPYDINGIIRLGKGNMGCYTDLSSIAKYNAILYDLTDYPKSTSVGDTICPTAVLMDGGTDTLKDAVIYWEMNGIAQGSVTWNGSLTVGQTANVPLGCYVVKDTGTHVCRVWLSESNATTPRDTIHEDDTATFAIYSCDLQLAGDYTVGPNGDFASVAEALKKITICGIKSDVTLKLTKGVHTEAMHLSNIDVRPYTLTFTSEDGNADSTIVRPKNGPVVTLDHCSGLVFKKITLDGKKLPTYCIQLGTGLDNIEFSHCNIIGSDTSVASNLYSTIYRASGLPVNNIRFIGNEILYGSYSAYFYGGNSTSAKGSNIVFDSNHVANYYYYGLYLYYHKVRFTNNRLDGARSGYSYDYGCYFYYLDSSLIDGNRFRTYNRNNYQYGLRVYYLDKPTRVTNNEFVMHNDNTTTYGLYVYYTYGSTVAHNSLLLHGNASTQYGLYLYTGSTSYSADIKNNIVVCDGNGKTTYYPLYATSTTAISTYNIDYNCWWSPTNVAYVAAAKTTLAAFQASVPSAVHDINTQPDFSDISKSLRLKSPIGYDCPKLTDVDYDIVGAPRNASTTMGAYTKVLRKTNAALLSIIDVPEMTSATTTYIPKAELMSYSTDTLREVTIRVMVNGVVSGNDIVWKGKLATYETDTVPLGSVKLQAGSNRIVAFIVSVGTAPDEYQGDDTTSVETYTCTQQFAGNYTIGQNSQTTGQYRTVREFTDELLRCGMSGPVTATILSGTLIENVTLTEIAGSSATNTLTFTSATGDSSSVIWLREDDANKTQTTTLAAPLILNGASHVIVRNLTLCGEAPNTTGGYYYSHGIVVTGSSHDVEVHNCHLYVPKSFTSAISNSNHSAVCIYQGSVNKVHIHHNLIEGGGTGCYVYGTGTSNRVINVNIEHNEIGYVDYSALYAYYTDSVTFSHNHAKQRKGNFTPSNAYATYLYYTNADILNNTFDFHAMLYGMYSYYFGDSTKGYYTVANNVWKGNLTAATSYGIYVGYYDVMDFYNNTLSLNTGTNCTTPYGLYCSTTIRRARVKNNIFCMYSQTANSYPIYVGSATYLNYMDIDNNCYYNAFPDKPYTGYMAGAKYTLAEWKKAVTMDNGSVSLHPHFIIPESNLNLIDTTGISCPTIPGLYEDVEGNLRDSMTTNMGAYHLAPGKLDASLLEIVSPGGFGSTKTTYPITIVVENTGLDTITSLSLNYIMNGISGTAYQWKGHLAYLDTAHITLGGIKLEKGVNNLTVYSFNPNNGNDIRPVTDTIQKIIVGCDTGLHGTYSIGTAASDFATLNEALIAAKNCGLAGPVVLEIASGVYKAVAIEDFNMGSDTNTLTLRSAARNRDSVTVRDMYALKLTESSNLIIEDITFNGTVVAVELGGMLENVEFRHCNIIAPDDETHTSYRAINYPNTSGSGKYLKDVRFIGNNIYGGCYNFYLYYPGSSTSEMSDASVTIDSNTLGGAYQYAIYSYYYNNFRSISHNIITNRKDAKDFYGMYIYYYSIVDRIEGNRIHLNNSSYSYGMYLYYYHNSPDYGATGAGTIANNEIVLLGENYKYGIYQYEYSRYNIINNSILVKGTESSPSYALYDYNSYSTHPVNIVNNMLVCNSKPGYALYHGGGSDASYGERDYNNYYSASLDHAYIDGSAKSTLAAIKAVDSTQDQHSMVDNPVLVPSNDPELRLVYPKRYRCPQAYGVNQTIDGQMRFITTSMGCYGVEPDSSDALLTAFEGTDDVTSVGQHPIRVVLANGGVNPIDSAIISFSINGIAQTPVVYMPTTPLPSMSTDTVLLGSFAFQNGKCNLIAAVSFLGDTTNDNDTITESITVCSRKFSGNILIGNSQTADYTFATLPKLISDAKQCGVNGDITLQIEDGKYAIPGMKLISLDSIMNGYHLTITSKSGDRSKVTISCTSGDLITLDGNENLTIRDLTLENSNGYVINFASGCKNIEILHCHLISSTTVTSSGQEPIYCESYGENTNGLHIIGNVIEGGYYGIYLYGYSSSSLHRDVVIDSNEVINQYYAGIYSYYSETKSISHNRVLPRTNSSAYSYWYGILSEYNNSDSVVGNYIDATLNTTITYPYAMELYYLNYYNVRHNAIVANNVIKANTTSTYYGVYAYYSRMNFHHNSVLMGGTGQGRALYYSTSTTYPMSIKGNLLVTATNQYPIYAGSTTAGIAELDYNNYYGNGAYVGYYGASITSLSNWQSTTGEDAHSISMPVSFVNVSTGLKLKKYNDFFMPQLPDVTEDFEGTARSNNTSMGAYTPVFQKLDATLTDFDQSDFSTPSNTKVVVTLSNYGIDTLTSATIEWTVNGVAQTSVKWTGSLPQFDNTTVTLGSAALTSGKSANITAWVVNPNNGKDMDPTNDTAVLKEFLCNGTMAGTYTVGGNGSDFESFEDAVNAMNSCGVGAPITLKLRTAITQGLVISGRVKGTNDTTTITVVPDGSAKVSINNPNSTALIVDNTAHWIFQGLTIGNTGNGMIGVSLSGMVQNVHFRNCTISASTTTTTSTYYAVYYNNTSSSGVRLENVSFIGNKIRGGYYNMYIYYMSGTSSDMSRDGVTIDSNIFSDAYYYGLYTYYYSHYNSISHNTITNRKGSTAVFYGIYNYYYSNTDRMEGNRIHLDNGNTSYGIYWYYYKNYPSYNGQPGVLNNNEVILSGNGVKYGIYLYYPYQSWEVVNNSIYVQSNNSSVYALYCVNASNAYKETIKNNLIVTKSTSTNYPCYLGSYYTSAYVTMDYNNYYNQSGTYIGYAGSAISSLSTWQATTGMDANSVNIRPDFIDSTVSLQLRDYSAFVCPRLASTMMDINNGKRSSHTAMGAYGVELYEDVNMQVAGFVTPQPIADVVCYADYTTVRIAIRNAGLKEADFTKSPLKISLDITGAANYHFDTTFTRGTFKYMQTDTIELVTVPTIASGIYRMKVTLNDTADNVIEDDTMSLAYNASRVELPYDINFSNVPDEFVNVTLAGNTAWNVVKGTGSNPNLAPVFGTGRLEFAGEKDPGAYAQAVFNAVNIQNCVNPTLTFWYAHSATCTTADMLAVLVTTDGGANYNEVKRILVADTATAWKKYEIDLSAFTQSSCLSVIFRAMSFGGANQSIDRIRITASQDADISLLPIDISERSACDNTPVDVKAVITNLSRLNIDMVNDTLSLNVSGAVNYQNRVVYNHHFGSFESDTVTLGQISLANNGNYYFNAWMQPFDDKTQNDTTSDSSLFIMQDIALDTVFGIDNQMFKMTGDTVRVSALAINNGNIPVDKVILHMSIDGNEVVADTVAQRLYPGDTLIHTMSMTFTVPAVHKDQPFYFFEMKAELACDADNTNDVINIVGQVNIPDSIDIQVLDITSTDNAMGKTKLSPTVSVANIGNIEADNIIIHVDVVDKDNHVVESISENISHMAINETKNHNFTMTYKVPNYTGKYTLKAYIEACDGDSIRSNDTLERQFNCKLDDTPVRDAERLDWTLGQNIPNPASSVTAIPFTLPQEGQVRISVMTANGQVVYRQEIQAETGDNRLELDASEWAAGIYYYTMEYRGQRITRKMNITR